MYQRVPLTAASLQDTADALQTRDMQPVSTIASHKSISSAMLQRAP